MTTTSWQKLLGFGACVALAAVACTVSSGDPEDDDVTTGIGGSGGDGGTGGDGGSGGSTTGNVTTGNVTTGNVTTGNVTTGNVTTTGNGGTGGEPEELDCLDSDDGLPRGEVATCEPADDDSCCTKCVAANCCESYSECFAFDPYNVCGGDPANEGTDSEILTFIDCMVMIQDGATPGTEEGSDFENCINEATETVSAGVCEAGSISGQTNVLAVCIAGDEDGLGGCFDECLRAYPEGEEPECTY